MKMGKTSRILQIVNLCHSNVLHAVLNVKYEVINPLEAAGLSGSVKNGTSAVPVTMGAGDTFWMA